MSKGIIVEFELLDNIEGKFPTWLASCKEESLGQIEWYSKWKRYVWTQYPDIIMSDNCLRQVADKITEENKRVSGR